MNEYKTEPFVMEVAKTSFENDRMSASKNRQQPLAYYTTLFLPRFSKNTHTVNLFT